MTITLQWWYLPTLLALLAFVIPATLKSQGDYDFGTPLIGLAVFAACMAGAVGILIGHFFS